MGKFSALFSSLPPDKGGAQMDDPPYSAGLKFVDPPTLGSHKNIINATFHNKVACNCYRGKVEKLSLIQIYLLIQMKGMVCCIAAEILN